MRGSSSKVAKGKPFPLHSWTEFPPQMHRSTRDCFVDNSAIILDTWACSVCTFLNLATSGTCEMCNTSINGFGGPPQIKKSMASTSYNFERLSLDLSFFQGLPNDISTAIFSLLDLKDVLNLYLVCKWFHRELCANDFVWKGLFIKTFSAEPRFVLMEGTTPPPPISTSIWEICISWWWSGDICHAVYPAGLDDNMRDIGWRRAFKLQYYLQVNCPYAHREKERKREWRGTISLSIKRKF